MWAWAIYTVCVVVAVWVAASLGLAGYVRTHHRESSEDTKSVASGFLDWCRGNTWSAVAVLAGYFGLAGYVFETRLYSLLGFGDTVYREPLDLLVVVFQHPALFVPVAGVAAVTVGLCLLLTALANRLPSEGAWKGASKALCCRHRLWEVAMPVLRAPVAFLSLVLGASRWLVSIALLVVVTLFAVLLAEHRYHQIEREPKGRVVLNTPTTFADDARHIGSTSRHMLVLFEGCLPASDTEGSKDQSATTGFSRALAGFAAALPDWRPWAFGDGEAEPLPPRWRPAVIPWSSIMAFDTSMATSTPAAGKSSSQCNIPRRAGWTHGRPAGAGTPTEPTVPQGALQVTTVIPREALSVKKEVVNRFIVGRTGTHSVGPGTTIYSVPFNPLQPVQTGDDGAVVSAEGKHWLARLGAAWKSCGVGEVQVVGHASKSSFTDRSPDIWTTAARGGPANRCNQRVSGTPGAQEMECVDAVMNCGLANLRALAVLSELAGETELRVAAPGLTSALDAAGSAREAIARLPQAAASGSGGHTLADSDMPIAKEVFRAFDRLCGSTDGLRGAIGKLSFEVAQWSDANADSWRWLTGEGAEVAALNRSVHVILEGSADSLSRCLPRGSVGTANPAGF